MRRGPWRGAVGVDDDCLGSGDGLVVEKERGGARLVVECDAARPHDWRREPYQTTLRRWAAAPGQEVLVFAGARGVRLGDPDTPVRRAG